MRASTYRSVLIRLWRLAALTAAVLVIREAAHQQSVLETASALTPERARDFFPQVASLGPPLPDNGWRPALTGDQTLLGYVTTTAPQSDKIIGYSGPTHSLMAFDAQRALIGIRVLKSHDTSDHLAEVVADRKFFSQFKGLKSGEAAKAPLHTVTGATLTSAAIAQGIMEKLGQTPGTSLRFPEEITLEEVKRLIPDAAALQTSARQQDTREVLNAKGKVIALAVRTAPVTDALIGYKGPSDTLMLLDATGTTLKKIALRRSYDTKRYVAYVTGDEYFLNLFNDRPLDALATLDFDQAKIEGVSGATETSYSVAEGLKRRAQTLLPQHRLNWRWQDTGHLAVLVSALVMAFTKVRGRAWARHSHHILLVLYVGLFAGEMLSQGLLTGWAAHGTPWQSAPGLVLLTAVALLGPVFTSKQLYCHHICPHGALQQLLARRLRWQWRVPGWLDKKLSALPFLLLGFILITVVLGISLDLNTLEPFDAYVFRVAGTASIAVAFLGLVAALFTPLAYCKYGCPTGAVFKLLRFTGDADRLGLRDWIAAGLIAALAFV